jgi:putative transposase
MCPMRLTHVNFHTQGNQPVFLQPDYDAAMRALVLEVVSRYCILCPVWEVMPTHMHLIVAGFDDYPRHRVIHHIKGITANGFFKRYPELREDLLGGHLWSKGYYWVDITSQRQYQATVRYILDNRANAGLEPPMPLTASGE